MPADSQCVLLLHMDGSNGSTTFTDSSQYAQAVTTSGTAVIDTSQSKFGGASGVFDGSNSCKLSLVDSANWDFGSGDFTIDLWLRATSIVGTKALVSQWGGSGNNGSFYFAQTGQAVIFNWSINGSSESSVGNVGTILLNTWTHLAVERTTTTIRFFQDGAAIGTGVIGTDTIFNSTRVLNVSTYQDGAGQAIGGWVDEVRIVKGRADFAAGGFTAPTSAYDLSAGGGGGRLACGSYAYSRKKQLLVRKK